MLNKINPNISALREPVGVREQHAYHILGLSKLPLVVGTLAGLLALGFIAKLQHTFDFADVSVTSAILNNFYTNYYNVSGINTEIDTKLTALLLALIVTI